jgi:hypothetical protein
MEQSNQPRTVQLDEIMIAIDKITADDTEQLGVHIRRGDLAMVHTYEMLLHRNSRIAHIVIEAMS